MNSEIKTEWVAALRSGKYTQGRHKLRQVTQEGTKHCCLGVLCEIYQEQVINAHGWVGASLLPMTVVSWAGLLLTDGARVVIDGAEHSLATHNDGEMLTEPGSREIKNCKTFAQIADAIEEQL